MAGRRPPLPADPEALPGGTFPGLGGYVQLVQRCWKQEPQDRPGFAEIAARLRELADMC